ncbi:hypothetical protein O0544_10945 [Edwardsiella anguillarum]|nr:hypothetical protein [Edwardsiella anguillarum]
MTIVPLDETMMRRWVALRAQLAPQTPLSRHWLEGCALLDAAPTPPCWRWTPKVRRRGLWRLRYSRRRYSAVRLPGCGCAACSYRPTGDGAGWRRR